MQPTPTIPSEPDASSRLDDDDVAIE